MSTNRRISNIRWGYVIGTAGVIVAALLIWFTIQGANRRAAAANHNVSVLETAVARYRNQISAGLGLSALVGDPTVSQLVGGGIVGTQNAPPQLTFQLPTRLVAHEPLVCSDATGAGKYSCVSGSPSPTAPKG